MLAVIIIIGIIAVFGLAFGLTGAVLLALLFILKLPLVLAMWVLGAVCCCTILLIPIGLLLFRSGTAILV